METKDARETGVSNDLGTSDSKKKFELLYKETADFSRYFLEWRYKLINAYFLSTSGILVITKWFIESPQMNHYGSIPFLVGTCFCTTLSFLDRVNKKMLRETWRVNGEIESDVFLYRAVYAFMLEREKNSGNEMTYSMILNTVYLGTALMFLIFAALFPFSSAYTHQ